jgi:hypothetical protein|tara:strand:- start:1455 stop:2042 length:588 start_codon:yes stop_codon:yes gene_type:complete
MTIYSNSPVIGKSQLSLIKPTAIDRKCIDVALTIECEWLLESETQVEYWHGGKLLKSGSCYNDFYGLLSCMNKSNGENAADLYSVTPDSSLEVRMFTTLSATPVKRVKNDVNQSISTFENIRSGLWYHVDNDKNPVLCEIIQLEKMCSWSSRGELPELEEARARLRKYLDVDYSIIKLNEALLSLGVEKGSFTLR